MSKKITISFEFQPEETETRLDIISKNIIKGFRESKKECGAEECEEVCKKVSFEYYSINLMSNGEFKGFYHLSRHSFNRNNTRLTRGGEKDKVKVDSQLALKKDNDDNNRLIELKDISIKHNNSVKAVKELDLETLPSKITIVFSQGGRVGILKKSKTKA